MTGKEFSILKMSVFKAKSCDWRELQHDLVLLFLLDKRIATKDDIMDACFDLLTKHNYEQVFKMLDGKIKVRKQGTVWTYALNSKGREEALELYARMTQYKSIL